MVVELGDAGLAVELDARVKVFPVCAPAVVGLGGDGLGRSGSPGSWPPVLRLMPSFTVAAGLKPWARIW